MLNYKHLNYFRMVANAGGIARAAEQLSLTPQTISGQLAELEDSLGVKLFTRKGRRLELTEAGTLALAHADEIFQIGGELVQALQSPLETKELEFRVGIADVVPKSIAYRLLAPALQLDKPVKIDCIENKLECLFSELSIHKLDLVIADRAMPSSSSVKGYSHLLGESRVSFFAHPELAHKYADFPNALHNAPMLLPGKGAALRGALERWFGRYKITPRIVGEFDDSALMKAFGQGGAGIFPAPDIIAKEIMSQLGVERISSVDELSVRYYAISAERKLTHPAVLAISQAAKQHIFDI